MTTEHTPTPYQASDADLETGTHYAITYDRGDTYSHDDRTGIIVFGKVGEPKERERRNMVLHQLNAHDALVAALDGLVKEVDADYGYLPKPVVAKAFPSLAPAQAALRLAKGSQS